MTWLVVRRGFEFLSCFWLQWCHLEDEALDEN
jgi:hypothetical protein